MMSVSQALNARISVRAFKPDPVPLDLLKEILTVSLRAPSGGNVQPWRIIAVAGAERENVIAAVKQARLTGDESGAHPSYPANLWEPYRSRRFKVGEDMYALLGIPREDRTARLAHVARNYEFFGAPVGLFFVIDKRMGHAQWAHLGMLMQSVALAAVERGLATCMQEAWGVARETLARHFHLPAEEMVYCAMALGWADEGAPVNRLRADRAPLAEVAEFHGF